MHTLPSVWLASRKCLMDHTMGNRMAQQQMMSTKWNTSRQVNQSITEGLSSSVMTMAMLANTAQGKGCEGCRKHEYEHTLRDQCVEA
eukprot:1161482-Pelagomonas_calceolata.AAC.2